MLSLGLLGKRKKFYCVIGMGKFGESVIESFLKLKQSVTGIDINSRIVEEMSTKVENIYQLNATNLDSLKELDVTHYECVIVSVGNNVETSILVCFNLIELKAKRIIAKAVDKRHEKILNKIGIKNVILPERESGIKAAYQALLKAPVSLIENSVYSFLKCKITNPKLFGLSLQQIKLSKYAKCNVAYIKRVILTEKTKKLASTEKVKKISSTEKVKKFTIIIPFGSTIIKKNDILQIFIATSNIEKIRKILTLKKN